MTQNTERQRKPYKRHFFATIVAETVLVLCPHCGEPQGNPETFAHPWFPREVNARDGQAVTCEACGESFKFRAVNRITPERQG